MNRNYYVYVLGNKDRSEVFAGVTDNLRKQVCYLRNKKTIQINKISKTAPLVHIEWYTDPFKAIERKDEISSNSLEEILALINSKNSHWEDLYEQYF